MGCTLRRRMMRWSVGEAVRYSRMVVGCAVATAGLFIVLAGMSSAASATPAPGLRLARARRQALATNAIVLQTRGQRDLERLVLEVANPHSLDFNHYASPAELDRRFGRSTTAALESATGA